MKTGSAREPRPAFTREPRAASAVSTRMLRSPFPRRLPVSASRSAASRVVVAMAMMLAILAALPPAAAGQDVEHLGRLLGTTPPPAYFQEIRENPTAFQFGMEGQPRLEALQEAASRRFSAQVLLRMEVARSLGPRSEPLVGTFRVPLVLGLYADTPGGAAPFDRDRVQREFFTGPNSVGSTIPEFYTEMSRGLLQLEGATSAWMGTSLTASQVTLGVSGLRSSATEGVGAWIEAIVQALDAEGMDWTPFDQTGDGYVDVLAVMHPDFGAECGGAGGPGRVWSHRWTVSSATAGRLPLGIRTQTPGPGPGGFLHINDYTIQPLLGCDGEVINQIGVFAHEMGHAFGLPDLYGTGASRHTGAGNWDLMATGSFGCQGNVPAFPCQMGAWSKAMLGWVEVEDLPADTDLGTVVLPPVQSSGRVFRVPAADGSPTWLLLENRQRIGSDAGLAEPGLLVWQIDDQVVQSRWVSNAVNADPNRMGVRIRTASGLRNLETLTGFLNRASPGDPHPGCIKDSLLEYLNPSAPCRANPAFHVATTSRAVGPGGDPLGITLTGIRSLGSPPHDMAFELTTRWTRIGLSALEDGVPVAPGPFRVDGVPRDATGGPVLAVPFQRIELEAPAGAEVEDGVRVGFLGWADAPGQARTVTVGFADSTFTARYGGREIRVRWVPELQGPAPGGGPAVPGDLVAGALTTATDGPDLWLSSGAEIALEARARTGFRFLDWVGDRMGAANPLVVTLQDPLEVGAGFELAYGFVEADPVLTFSAASAVDRAFPVSDANLPVRWERVGEGPLPEGLGLDPESGRLQGEALEAGTFAFDLLARDAVGLEAVTRVRLEISVPAYTVEELTGPWLGTGAGPQGARRQFLDWNGNRSGFYDLGDLRAHLLRHGVP